LQSISPHLRTGRAQRSEARTGAKRLDLCPRQFAAPEIPFETDSILKALQNSNKKTPEKPGTTKKQETILKTIDRKLLAVEN
jgi:hypothetical protein